MIESDAPVASTRSGRVRGFWQNGVQAFRGIPYGAPPVGHLRFMPPVPAGPWDGVRDASAFGPKAPAFGGEMWDDPVLGPYFTGGRGAELIAADVDRAEDCLVLNVLTPQADPADRRPVMVYLHGGGYKNMNGMVGALADRFVRERNIVLVTLNHRVNVFGFLYLGGIFDRYRAGNVGLLDLVLALRWVQDNINAFGGDPDCVTIFGESGGGWKTLDLLGMPAAKGLFHRAIAESAPGPEPVTREAGTARADKFLGQLGIGHDLDRLENLSMQAIVDAMEAGGPYRFRAVLDGETLSSGRHWVNGAPESARNIPLIVGNCKDEASHWASDPSLFRLDWASVVPRLADQLERSAEALAPIVDVYRGAAPDDSPTDVFIKIWSDRWFGPSTIAYAEQQSAQAATYLYHFTYEPPVDNVNLRAFHTAELPLAMQLVHFPESEPLSQQLSGAWASFARTGDPNHPGLPRWRPYRKEDPATMVFGLESRLISNFREAERRAIATL